MTICKHCKQGLVSFRPLIPIRASAFKLRSLPDLKVASVPLDRLSTSCSVVPSILSQKPIYLFYPLDMSSPAPSAAGGNTQPSGQIRFRFCREW